MRDLPARGRIDADASITAMSDLPVAPADPGLLARDGSLPPTAIAHLDHCLACLSCQKACPSQVPYGDIIERVREQLAPTRVRRPWRALTPRGLTRLTRAGAAVGASRWLPKLARVLPPGSRWRRLADELPRVPALPDAPARADLPEGAATVTLFPGCVGRVLERDTLAAARILLEVLGHRVHVPDAAVCCGALPRHAGEAELAGTVETRTRAALVTPPTARVLVSASGCLDGLRRHVMAGESMAVEDTATFIARDPGLVGLRFRPLAARAALHVPCTQASIGDGGRATRALLARIPGLEVQVLPAQPRCCGAAGTHFIDHPEPADRLRARTLDHVQATSAQLVLTSNPGCRTFLDNGLRRRPAPLPVLHPLALLARQLETAGP